MASYHYQGPSGYSSNGNYNNNNNYNAGGQPYYNYGSSQPDYFDPYTDARNVPHETYDQGGGVYRDDYYNQPSTTNSSMPLEKDQPFSAPAFDAPVRKGSITSNVRRYRYEKGELWTRGGGLRCCGRFFCCSLLIAVWMILGIFFTLALYLRPPNVVVGDAELATSNQFQITDGGGIQINAQIPITVYNPSYLNVDLFNVYAAITYPINNTAIGNGTLSDTKLPAHAQENFTFPFSINYTPSLDPTKAVITDILNKCLKNQDLTVQYDLTVGVKVLAVAISPSITNMASFACPFDASTASTALGGLDVGSIINGILGGQG